MTNKARSRLASLTLLEIAAGIAVGTAATLPASAQGAPPIPNWNGFYTGVHAGYRWGNADFTGNSYVITGGGGISITLPPRNEGYHPDGGIVGGHAGYNFQFAPNWLLGIEGDITWGNGDDTHNTTLSVQSTDGNTYRLNVTSELKLTWQGTVRGRLGYVAGQWLFYGTGGVAFARAEWSELTSLTGPGGFTLAAAASSASKTLTGFAAGAGAEYMIATNWIGRIEYLYENFGGFDVPFGIGQTGHVDVEDVHKIRVGISYRFGP